MQTHDENPSHNGFAPLFSYGWKTVVLPLLIAEHGSAEVRADDTRQRGGHDACLFYDLLSAGYGNERTLPKVIWPPFCVGCGCPEPSEQMCLVYTAATTAARDGTTTTTTLSIRRHFPLCVSCYKYLGTYSQIEWWKHKIVWAAAISAGLSVFLKFGNAWAHAMMLKVIPVCVLLVLAFPLLLLWKKRLSESMTRRLIKNDPLKPSGSATQNCGGLIHMGFFGYKFFNSAYAEAFAEANHSIVHTDFSIEALQAFYKEREKTRGA